MLIKNKMPKQLIEFLNASPSPFHATNNVATLLRQSGFIELSERENWNIQKAGKYFVTRNSSALVAFAVGGHCNGGFTIIGAHTDSPCFKVKPISKKTSNGYLQLGVQTYGGGIWHSWFDRDLSLAGRVLVKNGDKVESRLVKIEKPIMRIPTLAIHLDRTVNDGFKFNTETHLTPILATALKAGLTGKANEQSKEKTTEKDPKDIQEKHHMVLLDLIAAQISCKVQDIQDFELCAYDTQPSAIGGICDEFIFSPRLDNLMMSYCSTRGFLDALPTLESDSQVRVLALFDNEEVGSLSAYGADSHFVEPLMKRICSALGVGFEESVANSFLISADMAHAIHPNYAYVLLLLRLILIERSTKKITVHTCTRELS
jgi:aspartyl aminopeptidase